MKYSKVALRQQLIKQRQQLSKHTKRQAGQAAAEIFSKTSFFTQNKHFACYYSEKSEFDTAPLIEKIWNAKKYCYLPLISETSNNKLLQFMGYLPHSHLKKNHYDIFEPISSHLIALEDLDVIIAPLLGFDLQGSRLGMGMGYYDHTLSYLYQQNKKKCIFLGLAYEMQCIDALPVDAWDIRMNGVITEKRFISF